MENMQSNFVWRRLLEECPTWAIGVPVLFAFLVVGLIVLFRDEKKLLAALVGGTIVGVVSIIYLFLGYLLVRLPPPFPSWTVILIPVMAVAFFYVVMMYIRDAKSVHFLWALFLGLLRTCVYVILAAVFLLPGCQHSERQEYESKVIFVFDVSGSMHVKDGRPAKGQDLIKFPLPSRQDEIRKFLIGGDAPFMNRVVDKSAVTAYRFGPILDETDIINIPLKAEKHVSADTWKAFLKPDLEDVKRTRPNLEDIKIAGAIKDEDERKKEYEKQLALFTKRIDMVDTLLSGTAIGGSCLQMHKIENSSFIQAIIVISDGQSNVGSDDARSNFLARVNNPRQPIPVITIGVGQFRLPVSIRIDDINAPQETRPDDPFSIRVPVVGTGLHNVPFEVIVEVQRIKDVNGQLLPEGAERKHVLDPKAGKFKGAGDHPQDLIPFEIDVQKLKGIAAKDDKAGELEGEWHLWAKVKRHDDESFTPPYHVTDAIKVQVQKRALRVLLFAGSATREYQFLRSILYREMNEKRMEMCICNQSTSREDHIDQDVEPDRLLSDFPNKLGPNDPGQRFMSLNDYDVIVAFDPDWTKLTKSQLGNLEKWVGEHAGGIIFVAGPIFSHQVTRPGGHEGITSSLARIYPVVLKDARVHGLGGAFGHDSSRPYALHFSPVVKDFDFIKLDEAGDTPTAGWNSFFWNDERRTILAGSDEKPRRGFFTYYPVEKVKPASRTIAAFAGPKEARIGDKTDAFQDQPPFMVAMDYGSGKSLYIGSGEFWRLRAFKDGYHERLWIKMARYVAVGALERTKWGKILMARNLPVGKVSFEAQVMGKGGLALPMDLAPTVLVRRVDKDRPEDAVDPKDKDKKAPKVENKQNLMKFELKPKLGDGDWLGYFVGDVIIREPGEYEFQLPIPGVPGESLRQSLHVRKANPELDNVRTNFGYLYQLASDSRDLLGKLPKEQREKLESLLKDPEPGPDGKERTSKRLFFPLASADAVADCLTYVAPKTETVKGRFEDLWDDGLKPETLVYTYAAALVFPLLIGLIGVIILCLLQQWINALVFFGICVLMTILVAITDLIFSELLKGTLPLHFSYLLMVVVSLLGIEWLARKLLRLA
jgi:hypothetical protein